LYADLRSAQRLESAPPHSAAALVTDYELTQVQSVLLRAVRIEAEVRAARPDAYRELFRKLKFRQLLFRIEPLEAGGYRLEIDGPMSLFGATTKYGLELSLSLPALLSCGQLRLKAELRWGKRREKLSFEQTYAQAPSADEHSGVRTEVAELLGALQGNPAWQACLSDKLIDVTAEGGGVLVPDLELTRGGAVAKPTRRGVAAAETPSILVELLGFWSRDAVFRRIEAAQKGLSGRIPMLFVASSRLRVSEELLDGVEAASLYVYKGKINAAALLRKAEALI
jgi:predicted nuclease of restriction endonuclease-like RecB superfamily